MNVRRLFQPQKINILFKCVKNWMISFTAPETYWKIISRFLNNKKFSAIPPLLVNGEIISNFSQKTSIFNKFFAPQCTPLQNSSSLPTFYLRTDETLSSLNINGNDIFVIIKNLTPNKSHGWDTRRWNSFLKPLLQGGEFPDYWKKS